MPYVYNLSLGTPGTLTTSGSANTEVETFFAKPGTTAPAYLQALSVNGKGAAKTTLDNITLRGGKWGTASTGGTAMSITPRADFSGAAVSTASSRSTAGTTRTNVGPIISCSVTGAFSWRDNDPDNMASVRAGNAGSLFVADVGTSASLVFEFSGELREF
jgi:hypothetical protein